MHFTAWAKFLENFCILLDTGKALLAAECTHVWEPFSANVGAVSVCHVFIYFF